MLAQRVLITAKRVVILDVRLVVKLQLQENAMLVRMVISETTMVLVANVMITTAKSAVKLGQLGNVRLATMVTLSKMARVNNAQTLIVLHALKPALETALHVNLTILCEVLLVLRVVIANTQPLVQLLTLTVNLALTATA